MTEQPAEPVAAMPVVFGRRRIVTSMVLILSLFLGIGWWMSRPQIDPRFEGTWVVTITGVDSPPSRLVFEGDGEGMATPVLNGPHANVPFRWRIEDERLILVHNRPFGQRIGLLLDMLFNGGDGIPSSDASFKVGDISDDAIVLDTTGVDGTPIQWHLRRSE